MEKGRCQSKSIGLTLKRHGLYHWLLQICSVILSTLFKFFGWISISDSQYQYPTRAFKPDTSRPHTLHSGNLAEFLLNTTYAAYPVTDIFKGCGEKQKSSSEIIGFKLQTGAEIQILQLNSLMKTSDRKVFWTPYVTSYIFLSGVCLLQKTCSLPVPVGPT